jgi:hypothetical protein
VRLRRLLFAGADRAGDGAAGRRGAADPGDLARAHRSIQGLRSTSCS